MGRLITPLIFLLKTQKKMILLAMVAALISLFMFFPYQDLSDLITQKISQNSSYFVQFNDLSLSIVPLPIALKMSEVNIQGPGINSLSAGQLSLSPNILGLLTFSPGAKVKIDDVLGGEIGLTYKAGKVLNENTRLQNINIELDQISLKDLLKLGQMQLAIEGSIDSDIQATIDPAMTEQPEAQLAARISKFRVPSTGVMSPMGLINIPDTALSSIDLKGQLKNGDLEIFESTIGKTGDGLYGRIKGKLGIRWVMMGNTPQPQLGAYDIDIDLNLDKKMEEGYSFVLILYDRFKTKTGTGSRYSFHLSAPNTQVMATPSPARF